MAIENATVSVQVLQPDVQIVNEEVLVTVENPMVEIIEVAMQGLPGADGAGTPGITSVAADPAPALGGDLTLGGYNIVGQLENDSFILDGGLL